VPAWCGFRSDLTLNGSTGNSVNRTHWAGGGNPLIISTSRIAPNVRSPKTKTRPVAGRLERGSSQSEERRGSSAGRTARLTRREQQIVNLLLEGCDNTEIAGHLRIAQRTVKAYFNRLFLRFGITSGIKRVKLATFMYRSRLCSDMIFSSDAQLNGHSASSPSASVTGTPLAKLEPPSTSSRTVFGPSTTSWVCGTRVELALWCRARGSDGRANACRRTGAGHFSLGAVNAREDRGLRRNLDVSDKSI
jgi:DNA-binding CsgD family transcriptional regulator